VTLKRWPRNGSVLFVQGRPLGRFYRAKVRICSSTTFYATPYDPPQGTSKEWGPYYRDGKHWTWRSAK
jgi:hypothetical protein